MIRVLFLIRSLNVGGAERQLVELVRGLDKNRFAVWVATFYDGGALRSELEGLDGVTVISLRKQGRWGVVAFIGRLIRLVRRVRPDVVHGYLGVANELSLLAGRLTGAKVVWGLRASNMDFSRYDRASSLLFQAGAWLSRFAELIIVNSQAGKQYHVARGYFGKRMAVIHNGIDAKRFTIDREAGKRVRGEWDIADEEPLIGLVARLDPMKDHATFLRAAALLIHERPHVRFVCVGDGPTLYRQELESLAVQSGLGTCLRWAGSRADMPAVYNALDVLTSSSYGEGFPNAIGEGMACGIPCVVTDVGASAAMVGNPEQVVPPKDPEALLTAWSRVLELPVEERSNLGQAARARIVAQFSTDRLVRATTEALNCLVRPA